MEIQKVKELALANGFKLKEQASGNMDLNAYVYDFANAIEQAAKAHEAEKLKGWVVVPLNNTTIVAIERMVEQQVEASGITDDVFRLDGEKILNAAVEAQEQSHE